jgi:hypothetical protein
MKIVCPNDESHDIFSATVRLQREWTFDEYGEVVDTDGFDQQYEVVSGYYCEKCQEEADVIDE